MFSVRIRGDSFFDDTIRLTRVLDLIQSERIRFEAKMEELRTRLHRSMAEQFHKELNNSLQRVQDAIAPYTRFVRAEQNKTVASQEQLQRLSHDLLTLKNQIEAMHD